MSSVVCDTLEVEFWDRVKIINAFKYLLSSMRPFTLEESEVLLFYSTKVTLISKQNLLDILFSNRNKFTKYTIKKFNLVNRFDSQVFICCLSTFFDLIPIVQSVSYFINGVFLVQNKSNKSIKLVGREQIRPTWAHFEHILNSA